MKFHFTGIGNSDKAFYKMSVRSIVFKIIFFLQFALEFNCNSSVWEVHLGLHFFSLYLINTRKKNRHKLPGLYIYLPLTSLSIFLHWFLLLTFFLQLKILIFFNFSSTSSNHFLFGLTIYFFLSNLPLCNIFTSFYHLAIFLHSPTISDAIFWSLLHSPAR